MSHMRKNNAIDTKKTATITQMRCGVETTSRERIADTNALALSTRATNQKNNAKEAKGGRRHRG